MYCENAAVKPLQISLASGKSVNMGSLQKMDKIALSAKLTHIRKEMTDSPKRLTIPLRIGEIKRPILNHMLFFNKDLCNNAALSNRAHMPHFL